MVRRRIVICGLCVTFFVSIPVGLWACYGKGAPSQTSTEQLVAELLEFAKDAQSVEDTSPRVESILQTLRSRGPGSIDAMCAHRKGRAPAAPGGLVVALGLKTEKPIAAAIMDRMIDEVAQQRFGYQSKLYWHTSIDQATAAAKQQGRPILSLRMLGRLNEDLSCANSRFFRTILYADPNISKVLRENFVLHWQGVRDVPVVTIDYGNGRKLQRPFSGNSMHMVLRSDGVAVDALPGLVSPKAFTQWLEEAGDFASSPSSANPATVSRYHSERAIKRRQTAGLSGNLDQRPQPEAAMWDQVAAAHHSDLGLSQPAMALLAQNRPRNVENAMKIAVSKSVVETPTMRLVRNLSGSLRRDTAYNLYGLQPQIDDMFVNSGGQVATEVLVARVYEKVFLMPLTDPWLGLSPEDEFVALPEGGRIMPEGQAATPLASLSLQQPAAAQQ